MILTLHNTSYSPYIHQLGTLPAYRAAGSSRWFTTLEEARQSALDWYRFEAGTYRRACHGKAYALAAVKRLEAE